MRTVSRSIFSAFLIAVAVLCFTIGVLAPKLPPVAGRAVVEEVRSFTQPAAKALRLTNEDGFVKVRSHTLDDIKVLAEIEAYALTDEGEEVAESYVASMVDVRQDADTLTIVTEREPRPDALYVRVDYTIRVPEGTNLDIQTANGNVSVAKGCGAVMVRGRNADIKIFEPTGPVTARSMNGRIRLLDAVRDTDLETVNGNVYAHMLGGALKASTVNGVIVAHVIEPEVTRCDLTSPNGGITLVVHDGCSAQVDATTAQGVIKSDLPVDTSAGVQQRRRLRGTIGEGRTQLTLDTVNGNIWIARGRT